MIPHYDHNYAIVFNDIYTQEIFHNHLASYYARVMHFSSAFYLSMHCANTCNRVSEEVVLSPAKDVLESGWRLGQFGLNRFDGGRGLLLRLLEVCIMDTFCVWSVASSCRNSWLGNFLFLEPGRRCIEESLIKEPEASPLLNSFVELVKFKSTPVLESELE